MSQATQGHRAAAEFLEGLLIVLTENERLRFVSDLMVAIRKPWPELADGVKDTLDRWAATMTVRSHPQFAIDIKELKAIVEDGAAFNGIDLTAEQQERLQAEVVSG